MIIDYGNEDEQYRCRCNTTEFNEREIRKTWKCPHCNNPIEILLRINNKKYVTNRIKADQLKEGSLFAFFNSIHEILQVSVTNKNFIRLALKEYGGVEKDKDSFITIVLGSGEYW